MGSPPNRARAGCGPGWTRGAKDEAKVGAARRRLVEHGLPEERLLRFPADQVILLDEKREYDVRFDDLMKTMNLPVLAGRGAGRPRPSLPEEPALFADALVPGVYAVRLRAGAAGPADRAPAARRGPAPLRRRARRQAAREACPSSPCRCPTTRSPASRSAMRSPATRPTSAAARRRGEEKNPDFNVHYEVTLRK